MNSFYSSLEELFIDLQDTKFPHEFMESVSAHGRLIHVVLQVAVMTVKGVEALTENYIELVELYIGVSNEPSQDLWLDQIDLVDFEKSLKKKYHNRKVFAVGNTTITWASDFDPFFDYYQQEQPNDVFFPLS